MASLTIEMYLRKGYDIIGKISASEIIENNQGPSHNKISKLLK